jgi:hypothetical protein
MRWQALDGDEIATVIQVTRAKYGAHRAGTRVPLDPEPVRH